MNDLERAEHAAHIAAEASDVKDAEYAEELERVVKDIETDWRLILEQRGEPDCGMDEWFAWMCDDPQRLAVMTRVLASFPIYGFCSPDDRRRLNLLCNEFIEQCACEQIASNVEAGREFKRAGSRW